MNVISSFLILIMLSLNIGSYLVDTPLPIGRVPIGIIDTGISREYFNDGVVLDGKNYVILEKNTKDTVGHGTRIASIIHKLAPEAQLIPLVYQYSYPTGMVVNGGVEAMCKAIYDGVDLYECKIICISSGVTQDVKELREAVAYAEKKGVVIVSAVGNDNKNAPENIFYPAAYESVIGVGAVDSENNVADFSQRNGVSLVAQGVMVDTVNQNGKNQKVSGTSYACANAVGNIGVILGVINDISPKELRNLLYETAKNPVEIQDSKGYGFGQIDLTRVIEAIASQQK